MSGSVGNCIFCTCIGAIYFDRASCASCKCVTEGGWCKLCQGVIMSSETNLETEETNDAQQSNEGRSGGRVQLKEIIKQQKNSAA